MCRSQLETEPPDPTWITLADSTWNRDKPSLRRPAQIADLWENKWFLLFSGVIFGMICHAAIADWYTGELWRWLKEPHSLSNLQSLGETFQQKKKDVFYITVVIKWIIEKKDHLLLAVLSHFLVQPHTRKSMMLLKAYGEKLCSFCPKGERMNGEWAERV